MCKERKRNIDNAGLHLLLHVVTSVKLHFSLYQQREKLIYLFIFTNSVLLSSSPLNQSINWIHKSLIFIFSQPESKMNLFSLTKRQNQ